MKNPKKTLVLSLGGSLIVPDKINNAYLKAFKKFVISNLKKYNFIIITGGGRLAREYQSTGKEVADLNHEDLDWLGTHASRLNAQLLNFIFKKYSHQDIITVPTQKVTFSKPIALGAGWKPGWSTDYDAVQLAIANKVELVINLSNIDYAYSKDPRKFKDAQKIESIKWSDFRKIVGDKWDPGLNMPFDPVAAKLAQKKNIKVIITNGKRLNNLQNILNEKKYMGTFIS